MCNQAPTFSLLSGRRAYTYRFPRRADLLEHYAPDYVVMDAPNRQTIRWEQLVRRHASHHLAFRSRPNGPAISVYRMN
jgi:hypothetical protein